MWKFSKITLVSLFLVIMVLFFLKITISYHPSYDSVSDVGNWIKMTDSSRCDDYVVYKGNVYGTNMRTTDWNDYLHIRPLKGVDNQSFEVCKGCLYAKDKNSVYYPFLRNCIEIEEFWGSVTMYSVQYSDSRFKIENADPKTFKYIGDGYGIDKRHMYYNGEEIPWDDNIIKHQMEKHK